MSELLKEFVRQTLDEMVHSLPEEERLKGVSVEARLKDLSVEEMIRALTPEKLAELTRRLKGNGTPPNAE